MGYRSNVTYVVTFASVDEPEKAYAQFTKFYLWVTQEHRLDYKEEDGGPRLDPHRPDWYDYKRVRDWCKDVYMKFYWNVDEMTLVFEEEDIKWYQSFVDVQWHEQLLEKVKDYSCGAYKFIRLGEDPSDIECNEHMGDDVPINFCIDLFTETRIVCDLPDEKDFEKETS